MVDASEIVILGVVRSSFLVVATVNLLGLPRLPSGPGWALARVDSHVC